MKDDLIIRKLNGTEYRLSQLGIHLIDFNPPSPNWQRETQQAGKYGVNVIQRTVTERVIPLRFDIGTFDSYQLEGRRNQVFQLFSGLEPFYVISTRMPAIRWLVEAEAGFSYQPYENSSVMTDDVSVNLFCATGFGESISTTLNGMQINGHWDASMNIDMTHPLKYSYQSDKDRSAIDMWIYNGSVVPLYADELPVTIKFAGTSAAGVRLKNLTTDQEFEYTTGFQTPLTVYGIKPLINKKLVFENTNHNFLDFAVGWNHLTCFGFTGQLSFDTRFYF